MTFGAHNLHTFKRNTVINKLLLLKFYLINIRPKLHHQKWRKLRVTLLVNMSTVPIFLIQPLSGNSVINCRVWWSKICMNVG